MYLVIRRMEGRRPGLGDLSLVIRCCGGQFPGQCLIHLTGALALWPVDWPSQAVSVAHLRARTQARPKQTMDLEGQVSRSSHKLAGKPGDGDNSKRG